MEDIERTLATVLMRISGKYDALPMEYKPIVFMTVADFLPDRARGGTGKHLLKLMYKKDAEKDSKEGTVNFQNEEDLITNVAEETFTIMRFLYGADDIKNDTMTGIRKMFTQRGITEDNNYIDYLSEYFSVSQEVISNGFGVQYHKDIEVLKKHVNGSDIDKIISDYLRERIIEDGSNSSEEKIKQIHQKLIDIINHSDYLYVSCLTQALQIEDKFYDMLYEDDVFLCFDSGYLLYYASKLNEKQLDMTEHLINNIYKFVLGKRIGKNGYPE